MKKTLLLMLICSIFLSLNAQKTVNIQKIDSRAIIEQGVALFEQGHYDEAIVEFLKVPEGDPRYEAAQYELAYAQYEKNDYSGAIQSLRKIENGEFQYIDRWQLILMMSDSYTQLKQFDKALEILENGLQEYPYNYRFYFYKGMCFYTQKQYEAAKANFQKAIFLEPANNVLHYYYAMCNINLGYTIPGILALNFCTLLDASARSAVQSLQELDAIYQSGVDLYNKDNGINISPEYEQKNEFYADLIAMLNTAFATLPGYHNLSKIKHPVVASNQLVFSNVKQRPNSFTIEDQLYVPIFTSILQNKQYNTLTYYQFSGTNINNGKISKAAQKMGSAFIALMKSVNNQFEEIERRGLGFANPNDTTYIYQKHSLSAWGKRNPNRTDEIVEEGLWCTLTDNGQIATIATFVNGKAEGPATLYSGNKTEELVMKNGDYNGPYKIYYTDPLTHQRVLTYSTTAINNNSEGAFTTYNTSGILVTEGTMSANEKDGEIHYYNAQGVLSSVENYQAGEHKGLQKLFYPNGQLRFEGVEGEKNERTYYRLYHPNGQLSMESERLNGHSVGTVKYYFPNGAIHQIEEYDDNGDLTGEQTIYYRNGKLRYYVASPDSPRLYYTPEGQRSYAFTQSKGKVTGVTTYNADSTIRQTYPLKGKTVTFDIYSPLNFKTSTKTINTDGQSEDTNIDYYPSGVIRQKDQFKNGNLNGISIHYYPDGQVQSYTEYTDGAINGLHVEYFDNETNSVQDEAFYRNDTIIGPYYSYYTDGSIQSIYCYNDNGQLTQIHLLHPDGNKTGDISFLNGFPSIITYYGKSDQIIAKDTLSCGNGSWKEYHLNGKISMDVPMIAGLQHGTAHFYDFQGNLLDEDQQIISDNAEGAYRYYDALDNLLDDGTCRLGQEEGIFKFYEPTGELRTELFYEEGQRQGLGRKYYLSGKLRTEDILLNDEQQGISTYYAPDGVTQLYEIFYVQDMAAAYSVRQANGQMSDFTLIGNQPLTLTAYYPNGKVGAVINYNNGLLNGTLSVYYPNGQAAITKTFLNDLLNGKVCYYYPNGQLWKQLEHKDGRQHGIAQSYYDNGQMQFEATYWYDKMHGAVKQYDRNGKLTREAQVYYDFLESDNRY